jgi:hypothetical protein
MLGSARAVIMITGSDPWCVLNSRFRSKPFIPGIWMSMMAQANFPSSSEARKSSAGAKPRTS